MDDRGPAQVCTRCRVRWGRFGNLAEYGTRGYRAGSCSRAGSSGGSGRGACREPGSCTAFRSGGPKPPATGTGTIFV